MAAEWYQLAKLSLIIDGKLKTFHDKQKLKRICDKKWAMQKILQGILHTEGR
jgi:hypothetical protein